MSESPPDWLPALIDTNGSWNDVCGRLHEVYQRDLVDARPTFRGVPIWRDRRQLDGDQFEEMFWHLVTMGGRDSRDRLLDTPRACRLAWCGAVIQHSGEAEVLVFDYEEGNGRVRTYLWMSAEDYVVILERVVRRGTIIAYSLVTAFSLDGKNSRERLQRKYEKRMG